MHVGKLPDLTALRISNRTICKSYLRVSRSLPFSVHACSRSQVQNHTDLAFCQYNNSMNSPIATALLNGLDQISVRRRGRHNLLNLIESLMKERQNGTLACRHRSAGLLHGAQSEHPAQVIDFHEQRTVQCSTDCRPHRRPRAPRSRRPTDRTPCGRCTRALRRRKGSLDHA